MIKIDTVLDKLKKDKIIRSITDCKEVLGGTSSLIWKVKDEDRELIIKSNNPDTLKYESIFLEKYDGTSIFPKLIKVDKDFNYLIYDYIEGSTADIYLNKELFNALIEVLKSYKVYGGEGYGWLDELSSWDEFLFSKYKESKIIIENAGVVVNNSKIEESIKNISKYKFEKYLLHGDFGVHNFINKDGKLVGIIDPTPVVGDRIYDIIYALCSKLQFLNNISRERIYCSLIKLGYEKDIIDYYIVAILYFRIGACIKYHKEDLEEYLYRFNDIVEL